MSGSAIVVIEREDGEEERARSRERSAIAPISEPAAIAAPPGSAQAAVDQARAARGSTAPTTAAASTWAMVMPGHRLDVEARRRPSSGGT